MKPKNDPIDKELFKLMQESRHQAAADFAERVMQQLPASKALARNGLPQYGLPQYGLPQNIFRPLLSWRAFLCTLGITGAIGWLLSLLMAPSSDSSYISSFLQQYKPAFSLDLQLSHSWLILSLLLAIFLLTGADHLLRRMLS